MAMAMAMQSLLATPSVGNFAKGSTTTRMIYPSGLVPQMGPKRVGMEVKCMAQGNSEGKLTPQPPKKVSTSFTDVFAFSGPAPERINGRLAMTGFVAALAVELATGGNIFEQIAHGGVEYFIGATIILSTASLVPLLKGQPAEAKTDGIMNSDAEIWNGRLAMLGLVALAVTEYVKGGTLV